MKLMCRKCGLYWEGMGSSKTGEGPNAPTGASVKSFDDVARIQRMTCGGGGTHRLVGVLS